MNSFWTVVGFTIRSKLRGKAFLITTLIMVIILCIGSNLPSIISLFDKDGPGKATAIGYIQAEQGNAAEGAAIAKQLQAYYESQAVPDIKLIGYPDAGSPEQNEAELKQAIVDKKIKGYLTFGEKTANGLPAVSYNSEKLMAGSVSTSLASALQVVNVNRILQDSGISEQQKALLFTPVEVESVKIKAGSGVGKGDDKTPEEQGVDIGLATVISLMLFMGIMITGQMIASEITSEKSSRVMELLVTSVAPLKQMFGKIIGMCIIGLGQIVLYGIVIGINLSLPNNQNALQDMNLNLNKVDPLLFMYAIIYYLLGYFLYATLYAAIGSTVSRTEDLGQAVMPITMVSLVSFYISSFSASTPDSMLVTVASYVPFSAPYVMMLRIALVDPPVWEVLVSIAIMVVFILAAGWISAKIYRTGVLMYGKRPSIKEIRKAMKAFKV
ncbi:ABC transporter permease [Paenibacillus protaetiae]|uniref:ABC transporter permease n=1 Tax=Paenibacillus protaetiae TaxID=2509456 RepID=A0A4P6EZ60_9BACL|nr:ABC transporter permease [Paenibacillus protaetiae]QAY68055.1 ABC transporter permease [Paenibacillus protaetiae]